MAEETIKTGPGEKDVQQIHGDTSLEQGQTVDLLTENIAEKLNGTGVMNENFTEKNDIMLPARYRAQYDRLPDEIRSRCSWEVLVSRMIAEHNHYLILAMAMQDNGELAYIDLNGNPVFKEGGVEPVMQGMGYNKIREQLYKGHEEGTQHYGYEMIDSNQELMAIEEITGKPFVESEPGRFGKRRMTYMESGNMPKNARLAVGASHRDRVEEFRLLPAGWPGDPGMGVFRMLRVKEIAPKA